MSPVTHEICLEMSHGTRSMYPDLFLKERCFGLLIKAFDWSPCYKKGTVSKKVG